MQTGCPAPPGFHRGPTSAGRLAVAHGDRPEPWKVDFQKASDLHVSEAKVKARKPVLGLQMIRDGRVCFFSENIDTQLMLYTHARTW